MELIEPRHASVQGENAVRCGSGATKGHAAVDGG